MTYNVTSPVTGLAQVGLTSPTYTVTADSPPDSNAKQFVVSALGGTQTGVLAHTVAAPFTLTMWRPKTFASLGQPNPVTGVLAKVPMNTYKHITRKGVVPLAGQSFKNMIVTTIIEIPAGADTADGLSVKACLSAHFGAMAQQSSGIGDTVITGTL